MVLFNMGFGINTTFVLILIYSLLSTSSLFNAKIKNNITTGSQNVLQIRHISSFASDDEFSYSYDMEAENGPQNWGNLNPKWKLCGTGEKQSPIDILKINVLPSLTEDLIKIYKSAPAILKTEAHEVVVKWEKGAGVIIINRKEYKLVQCHWHTPSEHYLNGTRYKAELHMVHQNDQGDYAVVGILYKIGHPDPFLQWLLPYIKLAGSEGSYLGCVNPFWINLEANEYYRYNGSLTTPPCSESVTWTLFKKVRSISATQVRVLRKAIKDGKIGNARPLQPLNGRIIYYFMPLSSSI